MDFLGASHAEFPAISLQLGPTNLWLFFCLSPGDGLASRSEARRRDVKPLSWLVRYPKKSSMGRTVYENLHLDGW